MNITKTLATTIITGALLHPLPAQAFDVPNVSLSATGTIGALNNNLETVASPVEKPDSTAPIVPVYDAFQDYATGNHLRAMSVLQETKDHNQYQFFKNSKGDLISLYKTDTGIIPIDESHPIGLTWHNLGRDKGLGLPKTFLQQDGYNFAKQFFDHGAIEYSPLSGVVVYNKA